MSQTRILSILLSLGISLATATIMLATEPRMAIVWDEGYILGAAERIRPWVEALRDPVRFAARWQPPAPEDELMLPDPVDPPRGEHLGSRSELLFDRRVVSWFWPFAREQPHGYPPFSVLLALAGDLLAPHWEELARARLGPILLFSLTAGAIFQFGRPRWGTWAAALAAGAWVLQPNLFGHGHYACFDGPLSALWVLAILAFLAAIAPRDGVQPGALRWGGILGFGLILGCAAATKLTGWFLPLPFLVWAVLYRDRRALVSLGLGLLIALVVVYLLIPPWWTDPVTGVARFFRSNLTRGKTLPIYVQFLHTVYLTPRESLPWYNTMVWTVFVTPAGFLLLAGLGFWTAVRRRRSEPVGVLIAGHWAFLMVLRALPHTPGHDGVRQFLPAFGMLALLAGLGARALRDRWGCHDRVALTAAVLEGVVSVAVMMPVPLSYFSPIVGGLPGATALGMEPTYYWDALSPDARRWLADHTPPGRTFVFAWFTHSFQYLRRTGALPRRIAGLDRGQPLWYVLQNRPGAFAGVHRALVARSRAAYTVTKLGVPLLWIFPYSEYQRWNPQRPRDRIGSRPEAIDPVQPVSGKEFGKTSISPKEVLDLERRLA
jgi:hypothetical protein